jgi:phosphoglycolate phosphatase
MANHPVPTLLAAVQVPKPTSQLISNPYSPAALNRLELGSMKRIIIFDFDGVLADSLEPMLRFANQVCQELGVQATPSKADLEALDKMEFSEFGRQVGIPENQITTFVQRNQQLFYEQDQPPEIVQGMQSVISSLAGHNTLAIITGNSCKVVENFLEKYQIRNNFQIILCDEHKGNRLEKIRQVMGLASNHSSSVYMIGDAVSDIRAAHAAGITSIAVSWGHQSVDKLSQANPDVIVQEPENILDYFSTEIANHENNN